MSLTTILANRHLDLRLMRSAATYEITTVGQLEGDSMTSLQGQSMLQIEETAISSGENWTLTSGTGISSIAVGPVQSFNNWSLLTATCNGSALNFVLTSSQGATASRNISTWNEFSLVAQLSSTGTISGISVNLTSDPNGIFGNGLDSGAVALVAGTASEWKVAVSSFASNLDPTNVTGIQITVTSSSTPPNGSFLYIGGIRVYETGYDPSYNLDINTILGAVMVPVNFQLSAPTNTVPLLVRGNSTPTAYNPVGENADLSMTVTAGLLQCSSSGTPNTIDLVFREDKVSNTYSLVTFSFWGTDCQISAARYVNGVPTTAMITQDVGSTIWNLVISTGYFICEAILRSNIITVNLYQSNAQGQVGNNIFTYTQSSTVFQKEQGRMGWGANLIDRDLELTYFNGFFTTLASLTSQTYQSLSPVSGAQISASYSPDENLFSSFTGLGTSVTEDFQKVTNGAAFSWTSTGPIFSNQFVITDLSQTRAVFDIWIPSLTSGASPPSMVLRSTAVQQDGEFLPLLVLPNQWTHLEIPFSQCSIDAGNQIYSLYFEESPGQALPYQFWIANMLVLRRTVAWSARANQTAIFRPFNDCINTASGALHFPMTEYGTQLQIQAEALTSDAWVSNYQVTPIYAQLGKPLSYQASVL